MSRWRWSWLYPRPWREEFGEEFDALLERVRVGPRKVFDIIGGALAARASSLSSGTPFGLGWAVIAVFNVIAKEVQWPAGFLLLFTAIATSIRPRRWLRFIFFYASAIPVSSLYFYQIPGIHHEPLYKTAVALIPAGVGALLGLAVSYAKPTSDGGISA